MINWTIETIILDLKYTWKISRNATDQKQNLIVVLSDGIHRGYGEAAPNIRYGETPELLTEQFRTSNRLFKTLLSAENCCCGCLRNTLSPMHCALLSNQHGNTLKRREKNCHHRTTGNSAPEKITTSYTISIMDPAVMKSFYAENKLDRFPFVKLKINAQEGYEMTRYLCFVCNQK